jgi:peptidoglycan-associated lipoprotein
MRALITAALILSGTAIACSKAEQPPPRAPIAPVARTEPPVASPTRSVVNISDDIRKACGLSDADAHFAFDSAKVSSSDHPVLRKLVTCFSSGNLANRTMRLVGHADPRGGEEYNLVLAGSRAAGVKEFLVGQGLRDAQATTTSRGEMDAKGIDEGSWAEDRRVDILLAN